MGLIWPKKAELLNYTPGTSCVVNVGDLPQVKINRFKLLLYYCNKPLHRHAEGGGKETDLNHQSLLREKQRGQISGTSCGDNLSLGITQSCPPAQACSMGTQQHQGRLQLQGSQLSGLRDVLRGASRHCCAAAEGYGLSGAAGWRGNDKEMTGLASRQASSRNARTLPGMEDELAGSLRGRISGQTSRGDLVLWGSAIDLLTRKKKLRPSSNS